MKNITLELINFSRIYSITIKEGTRKIGEGVIKKWGGVKFKESGGHGKPCILPIHDEDQTQYCAIKTLIKQNL